VEGSNGAVDVAQRIDEASFFVECRDDDGNFQWKNR
jgi:hypothetical protein